MRQGQTTVKMAHQTVFSFYVDVSRSEKVSALDLSFYRQFKHLSMIAVSIPSTHESDSKANTGKHDALDYI